WTRGWGGCGCWHSRAVPTAVVQKGGAGTKSTPDDHLAARPHCRVRVPANWRVGGAGGCPTVGGRVVSPTCVQIAAEPAPDYHLAARPDCRVIPSRRGRVGGAGGCPTVGAGIVASAGVQWVGTEVIDASAPDDHFATGPHCRVIPSGSGRVSGAGSCPTIGAGIISPAGVKKVAAVTSAPDD